MAKFRVRFAPSPTGALHIGGIRTALYNYLLARKHQGAFLLRIEDTDQNRFVPGAEEYIIKSLQWCGILPDEGPVSGGDYGPYRQSERQHIYRSYAEQLVANGYAYYAFDTPEELEARREMEKERGNHTFKYDGQLRLEMKNSLSLPEAEVRRRLDSGAPYVIRLKVPVDETVVVQDQIRGEVAFQSNELDDKVILKGDGLPTYHLANVVDDHLMEITHVIRGEEWLPSTAHHVLLYRFLGWEDTMPEFAHLPLILKPDGKGKLSKRDGTRLGIPVFPLSWKGATPEDSFVGFREFGFDPRAVVNFLALLGWNPGTEQELFTLDELVEAFSLEKIGKAGARFDFDKALWFNKQYIMNTSDADLARAVRPLIEAHGHHPSPEYLAEFCGLLKERVSLFPEFWTSGYYFFEPVRDYDEKTIAKRWKPENRKNFEELAASLRQANNYDAQTVKSVVEAFMQAKNLKFGEVLPILRIAVSGSTQGPAVFEMMALLGQEKVDERLLNAFDLFDRIAA